MGKSLPEALMISEKCYDPALIDIKVYKLINEIVFSQEDSPKKVFAEEEQNLDCLLDTYKFRDPRLN